MIHSTRIKLIITFLLVSFLVGGTSLLIGSRILYNAVLEETGDQATLALRAADDVYQAHVRFLAVILNITALGEGFRTSVTTRNQSDLMDRLERLSRYAELDFTGIVLENGVTLCRIGGGEDSADSRDTGNAVARYVLAHGREVSGSVVLPRAFLETENPDLTERIRFYPDEQQTDTPPAAKERLACIGIAAAIPIFEYRTHGDLTAVLYGGNVLNQSTGIVDSAQKSMFFSEIQQEQTMPTVTVFFNDIRIATNMVDKNGNRTIGDRVPGEVKQQVLVRGRQWTTQQQFQDGRYISAYEAIPDITGRRIGMLSIDVPESLYADTRRKFILAFIIATVFGVAVAVAMGLLLTRRIMSPMHRLIQASQEVSAGNVSPDIGPISKDREIAVLQKNFETMVASMKRRQMESQSKILQSEKQASVGRLAAGVAHEINNPLTGVLTYTHMLLRRKDIGDDVRSDLQVIVESTERVRKIVKGLLDFSRQTKLDPEPSDIDRLMGAAIKLIENQALLKGVRIEYHPGDSLPQIVLDRSQMQSVFLNILLNALDAAKAGDVITITTAAELSAGGSGRKGVEVVIEDTGCGIAPENLNKLFDPFFSTKEVGRGTGLGLSVSLGIVKGHGGDIRVQSEVGKGSRFFVWLPAAGKQVENENTGG